MAIALSEAVDTECDGSWVISRSLEGGHGRIWEALQDTLMMQSYAISNMAGRSQIKSSLMRNVFLSVKMVRYLKRKSKATTGGPGSTSSSVASTVKNVIDAIRSRGDAAVREYSEVRYMVSKLVKAILELDRCSYCSASEVSHRRYRGRAG